MRLFLKILNISFIVLILLLVGFMLGRKYDIVLDEDDQLVGLQYSANEQKIRRLVSLINDQYMEDINTDSLVDNAIYQIVGQLDPHSTYLSKDALQKVEQEMSGSFEGLGIQIRKIYDTITITQVLEGSPNFGKLAIGDRILKIEGNDLGDLDAAMVQNLFRNSGGEPLNITVLRDNIERDVLAEKGNIPMPSVTASFFLNDQIGYIKLTRFTTQSAEEFHKALSSLKEQGMETLVLDLRGNPGGIMKAAEEIADEFLKKNELIVYTQDRDEKRKYFYATQSGLFEHGKIYVLIDESSASASEILAGALQEYGRGTLIGRRSFGKGLVQREISLGDGTRVRLTVAHYYTPSGRSIQRPYDEGKKAYSEELYRRLKSGELYSEDSIRVNEDLKYITPSGKTVYGGGGIIPDVFVPVDTMQLKNWLVQHAYTDRMFTFFLDKIVENRYNPFWMNENWFLKYYDVTPLYDDYLERFGIYPDYLSEEETQILKDFIRAAIAEQLFGVRAKYRAWLPEDLMIQKVLELENQESP